MKIGEKLSYLGLAMPVLSVRSLFRSATSFDPIGANGVNVRVYDAWPENEKLIKGWETLSSTLPQGTAFQSPAWQKAVARPFLRVGRFRLAVVSNGDAPRAVLPLQVTGTDALETPGEMISDYLDPLVDPADASTTWKLLLEGLQVRDARSAKQITLHNVRESGRVGIAEAAAEMGYDVEATECAVVTRVPLAATWDEYLSRLPGRDRKELKRKLNNAVTRASAKLVIHDTPAAVDTELERIFGYMRDAGGAKGIKARWTYRPLFKRAAGPLVSGGRMKVYSLELDGQSAAGLISFPSANGPLLWAAGFNREQAKWSPGMVLFAMAIQDAIASGAQCFDLLRGQQRYKSELGAVDSPLHRVVLKRRAA